MPVADSIQQLLIKVPNRKLHVVVIGNDTRVAQGVLNQPPPLEKPAVNQFVIYEQATPERSTYNIVFNHFISLTGEKLQACVKITECPPETEVMMARDSEVRFQMTECLASADIIIVSVGKEDVADFEYTRLYRIVAE